MIVEPMPSCNLAASRQRGGKESADRPGCDLADLLKLYLYDYLNRVRSSRCLAAEAGRHLGEMWMLSGLRPDFRRVNVAAFKQLFRSFVLLCRRATYLGGSWWPAARAKGP